MSCFGGALAETYSSAYYYSSSSGTSRRPWRWWRAKCAGIAAAVGSRLRRSIRGIDARRRRRRATSSSVHDVQQRGWYHHHRQQHQRRSFASVYVDELYSHHLQPAPKAAAATLRVVRAEEAPTSTSDDAKLAAAAHAAAAGAARATAKAAADAPRVPQRAGAAATTATAGAGARATGGKQARAAAVGVGGAMRNVLLRSPGRGGGGVLGVVKGMGEVDLRAELFIRKFKEDMRLQSQRSAEEFQAMLARGL